MVQGDMFKKEFTIVLNDEEIAKRARHLAGCGHQIRSLTEELKAESAEKKDKIKALKVTCRELEGVITAGAELQAVDCWWRAQDGKPFMDLVRADTMEVVSTRAMSPDEEREAFPKAEQEELPTEGEKPAEEKAAAGEGSATEEKQPKKAIAPVYCPAIVDAATGKTCGADGSRRVRGFCKSHNESLTAEQKAQSLVARTKRQALEREAADAKGNGHVEEQSDADESDGEETAAAAQH